MTDQPLYTLRDIATELQLPESTVRYYRDAFAHHLATIGSGRRRRYPPEAVATLRLIALWYSEGRTREQIEHELSQLDVPEIRQRPPRDSRPHSGLERRSGGMSADVGALLTELMDGERERRQAMWQMAREIVRLGEAVERQQATLIDMTDRLASLTERALPPGRVEEALPAPPTTPDAPIDVLRELDALREELANEKDLVERLRRSKLEIERRAAQAEEQAGLNDERDPAARRSMFSRLRSRDT